MFFNYGYKVGKILNNAEKERYNLCHPYVGSEHLLLSILKYDDECINIFNTYNINYQVFKEILIDVVGSASKKQEINLYTPLLKKIIANATDMTLEQKREVTCKDLVISLLEEAEGIAYRLLLSLDVDPDKLYKDLRKTNNKDDLTVLEIGNNLNKTVDMNESVIGREDELNAIIEILLRKKKNNPILIGKAGVGKTAIVEQLARKINKKEVPNILKDKQIISIEMGSLVAGTKYRGEFEERLTKIINEIKDNNIIIFIDEIHSIVNAGGSEGAINAADILKPYMARGNIKVIGATTEDEYEKYIVKDKALERRFEKINVEEPSLKETEKLMLVVKKEYEDYHNIKISDDVIKYLVTKANELIPNKNNPDKCIELLDSVCSHVKLFKYKELDENKLNSLKNKYLEEKDFKKASYYLKKQLKLDNKEICVTKQDVLNTIEYKINIPNKKYVLEIESNINNECIINVIKDKYNNIDKLKTILLIGDDSKLLNHLIDLYNPKSKAIIIDLKEYDNLNKLLGVSAGYIGYEDNYALKSIINNPYSLVVFKNIDKVKREVKTIINKIIKEGKITNGRGEELDFTKSLIIATKEKKSKELVGFNNHNSNYDKEGFNEVVYLDNILTK